MAENEGTAAGRAQEHQSGRCECTRITRRPEAVTKPDLTVTVTFRLQPGELDRLGHVCLFCFFKAPKSNPLILPFLKPHYVVKPLFTNQGQHSMMYSHILYNPQTASEPL